eukprot:TRINITY_DN14023_c0_g1_i1.p1 TRINITY_DN14023_c0_g1~~TRINITY_DN14023_c0_g1_i1.p1  ORF type:complete len:124 (+),score=23.28 TRINITY_DN14023_c0_g1_i1:39-374(+)
MLIKRTIKSSKNLKNTPKFFNNLKQFPKQSGTSLSSLLFAQNKNFLTQKLNFTNLWTSQESGELDTSHFERTRKSDGKVLQVEFRKFNSILTSTFGLQFLLLLMLLGDDGL